MSRILAMDTSTIGASVAVLEDDKILGEEYTAYKLKHSEKLLPMVKHLLEDVRLTLDDIDYFAVGNGPGSFTGLRIAAATVKAFSQTKRKPIISVSSLEACANNLKGLNDVIFIIFDAQRHDTYFNLFIEKDGKLEAQYEDSIKHIEDVILKAKEFDKVLFAGDGIVKYKEKIKEELGDKALFASTYNYLPKASGVLLSAKEYLKENKNIYEYDNFLPNYIRPSAAEEQKKGKIK